MLCNIDLQLSRGVTGLVYPRQEASRWFGAVLGPALLLSCSDGARVIDVPSAKPEAPVEGASSATGDALPTGNAAPAQAPVGSAVMLVGQVYGPDSYSTYVGVFAEVPEGDVDMSSFREFGNANAYTSAGYVFVEEDGIMQRFSVDESLRLVDGPRFSWQDFGIAAINTTYTVFVSAQRAYTFAPELGVIIVWNPATMERTGTLPIDLPARPAGMETFAYDGHRVGDHVFWNVFSGNWDSITPYPSVTLVIAGAAADDEPVRIVEDSRCLPGGPARVDENGDYYLNAGGYYGYFLAYGDVDPAARTCMLRVRAGQTTFDPDFLVDYQELTGSYVSDPWFHVSGSQYVSRSWDPAMRFPAVPDDFWEGAALRPLLVDTVANTAVPYPSLAGAKAVDGTTREVDGVSYYQLSQTGYIENGNTDVVELHPDGIIPRFHLDGFLLGLERVR
jgi:hypothetical protein